MHTDELEVGEDFLAHARKAFRAQKRLAERAFSQLKPEHLHATLDDHTNSIVIIMKHLAGNMLSRWMDFLTTDGEKDWRNRDTEFVDEFESRDELFAFWERGWSCLFNAVDALTPEDLLKVVTIRGHDHTVIKAILRQVDHYGYHVGQIVLLARHFAGDKWETLSIPRGGSLEFNESTWNNTRRD